MKLHLQILLFLSMAVSHAVSALEYRLACGEVSTQTTSTTQALMLIGGAEASSSAEIPATQWLLNNAPGGDYLVLRAGGTGSQASWVCDNFSSLINSAAELSVDSRADANDSTLVNTVRHAEIIFIAGGDQNEYEDNWKGTALEDALNDHFANKPIAGTSAGMAILGQSYYSPAGTGMIGSEILNDPYHRNSDDINHGDFLLHPFMKDTVTDTHIDRKLSRETRHSRLFGLLARSVADRGLDQRRFAIGLDEGTFLAIDSNWMGTVFGNTAYFLKTNGYYPERITSGAKLIWDHNGQAVDVYRIEGDNNGHGSADLFTWDTFSGGEWQYWFTTNGFRKFSCKRGC